MAAANTEDGHSWKISYTTSKCFFQRARASGTAGTQREGVSCRGQIKQFYKDNELFILLFVDNKLERYL